MRIIIQYMEIHYDRFIFVFIRISEFGASRYIIAHPTEQTEIVASVAV